MSVVIRGLSKVLFQILLTIFSILMMTSCSQTTNPPTQAAIDSTGKPAEVPQNIWDYAIKAASELGKDKNFALLLCAMIKHETSFGADLSGNSPSVGDGLMQVEPSSRDQLASEFQSTFGHAYDNNSPQDQVRIGALAMNNCLKSDGGNIQQALLHYNGGDNWTPDTKDAYGRTVDAQGYSNYIYRIYKSYGGT